MQCWQNENRKNKCYADLYLYVIPRQLIKLLTPKSQQFVNSSLNSSKFALIVSSLWVGCHSDATLQSSFHHMDVITVKNSQYQLSKFKTRRLISPTWLLIIKHPLMYQRTGYGKCLALLPFFPQWPLWILQIKIPLQPMKHFTHRPRV